MYIVQLVDDIKKIIKVLMNIDRSTNLDYPLSRSFCVPLSYLLPLHVLQPALVEADLDNALVHKTNLLLLI